MATQNETYLIIAWSEDVIILFVVVKREDERNHATSVASHEMTSVAVQPEQVLAGEVYGKASTCPQQASM